ncbi:hypothetical protein FKM82_025863 [Ascaphus truei]
MSEEAAPPSSPCTPMPDAEPVNFREGVLFFSALWSPTPPFWSLCPRICSCDDHTLHGISGWGLVVTALWPSSPQFWGHRSTSVPSLFPWLWFR